MAGLHRQAFSFGMVILLAMAPFSLQAARVSDVSNTVHNLSTSGTGTVKTSGATTTDRICVFCHTPHGAEAGVTPLWNRSLNTADTYTTYYSESLDANTDMQQPGGSSKLCLSCHDGTIAIGSVNVLDGNQSVTLDMTSTYMPAGTDGYTRNLGTDLSNDHPISFSFNAALESSDGELYSPGTDNGISTRVAVTNTTPKFPLENTVTDSDSLQCSACHDPHIKDDAITYSIKFLRSNRFQAASSTPVDGSYSETNDIICLACHKKYGWADSAHSVTSVADETYVATSDAVTMGDFPTGLPVYRAACLNCHDTHTVQGANRLLRGGVDGSGNPAIEETCYQCHDGTTTVLSDVTNVPDIKTDYTTLGKAMPITVTEGAANGHAIGTVGTDTAETGQRGKDLIESRDQLAKRHAECTDCHNPHRVRKNAQYDGGGLTTQATHRHTAGVMHTNEASGVLSGTWGVEPDYTGCGTAAGWGTTCTVNTPVYDIVRGPAIGNAETNGPVTKEYQVCLKCHSEYGFNGTTVAVGAAGTASGTNGVINYTDQGFEFQGTETGENTGCATAATCNHTSWHPVIIATGRTAVARGGMNAANFLAPWNDTAGVGTVGGQTMYCTDCHGPAMTTTVYSVDPAAGAESPNWGPHGSSNDFILKGPWGTAATSQAATPQTEICFKCHDWNQYAGAGTQLSGFRGTAGAGCPITNTTTNMHTGHAAQIGAMQCTWCHVAVPHGWQNKALLVDITSDVDETGANIGVNCATANTAPCSVGPYYLNAQLGGGGAVVWKESGTWTSGDCGGVGWMNGGGAGAGMGGAGAGAGCPY